MNCDAALFRGEWSLEIARTVSRVAKQRAFFSSMDIQLLHELGSSAEPAIDELARFVAARLVAPEELTDSKKGPAPGNRIEVLRRRTRADHGEVGESQLLRS